MRVSVSIFVILCVISTVYGTVDFSSVSGGCGVNITSSSNFMTFMANGVSGFWSGNKNICFQPGMYVIPVTGSFISINSAQTWYGAQFATDPTCGTTYNPSCARLTSSKSTNTAVESVLMYTPTGSVFSPVLNTMANFGMIGFAIHFTCQYSYFILASLPVTLTNNYVDYATSSNTGLNFIGGGTITNNYMTGGGSNIMYMTITGNSFINDNFFNGKVTPLALGSSATMTVSGNVFYTSSLGIQLNTATAHISNNTFIASYQPAWFLTGTATVDNNLFVGYSQYYITPAVNAAFTVTNNLFAGPNAYAAIYGRNPAYLAFNDFIDCGVTLASGGNLNVSSTYVLDNYGGDNGAWEKINNQLTGNTQITTFSATFNGYDDTPFPVSLTPNRQDLPNGHWIQNVAWSAVTGNRTYWLVGDKVNITWTWKLPSWYDKFNIPLNSLPSSVKLYLYHGANDNNSKNWATVSLLTHYGQDMSYTYTLTSSDVTGNSGIPYYMCVAIGGTCFATNLPSYIFAGEIVSLSLNVMAINGVYYTDQITANVFTDLGALNITFSLVNTVHPQSYPFLFYANGTGLNENITLPVHSATNNVQDWELQVTFTLPDGTQYEKSAPLSVYINPPPNSCYHSSITVDKGLKQTNPIQRFTLQDLGCNTTDWQIASVNNSLWYEYDNHEVVLNISAALSGGRPVHYQITDTVVGKLVHNVATNITIVNHNPVINSATFTWTYPRTKTVFPAWNLLSNCTDQDGDSLSVVQIQRTKTRTADSVQQLDPYTLLFVPEKAMVQVAPTGEITLSSPSNTNKTPVTAGTPLTLFWNKDLSFQFEITDGDIDNANVWGTASINSV
eukprot:TRINITY_DN25_c0_g1_i2.p1 TRINITY_DN25_c0_g1~~TRINITY_DN25_c0_g1_i2.p1  ORF type:complete len:842 (-),score=161.46 TRINITY_DN25_c0_g1_i2:78-2603(-)